MEWNHSFSLELHGTNKLCACSRMQLFVRFFVLTLAFARATFHAILRAHCGACSYIFPTQLAGFGDFRCFQDQLQAETDQPSSFF